jgi:hypothetical protein
MNDETANQPRSGAPEEGDGSETLSGREILFIFAVIALVCVGGYFFIMKLIGISQEGDCILAHRGNCAASEGRFKP